jgi:hypothetical protein
MDLALMVVQVAVVTIKQDSLHLQVMAEQEETVQHLPVTQEFMQAAVAEVLHKAAKVLVVPADKAAEAEVAEETLALQEFKPEVQTQAAAQVEVDKQDQVLTVVQVL